MALEVEDLRTKHKILIKCCRSKNPQRRRRIHRAEMVNGSWENYRREIKECIKINKTAVNI